MSISRGITRAITRDVVSLISTRRLVFDGTSTIINIAFSPDGTSGNPGRIEATFIPTVAAAMPVVGNTTDDNLRIRAAATSIVASRAFDTANISATGMDTVTLNQPNTISIDWAGGVAGVTGLEFNGVRNTDTQSVTSIGNLIIGSRTTTSIFFAGQIYDVKYWDNAAGTGDPVHHWPIDDDNGSVIRDIGTGPAINGVLTIGGGSWQ